jgi:GntR family transcriptional regulator/MocR family aminotransferase
MGTTSPELLIELDRSRPRGLRSQIEDGLRDAIRSGRLLPGTRLPSSRALAADLEVTRGVVVDAYDQLAAEGYVSSVQGSGTVVNDVGVGAAASDARRPADRTALANLRFDFRTGLPDLSLFPRAAWARATRAALLAMPDAELGYGEAAGLPRLRQSIAGYLGRVRGVSCTPEQVIICSGFGHGFSLVLRALVARGYWDLAVEDPGYVDPGDEMLRLGGRVHSIPVDDQGFCVDELAALRIAGRAGGTADAGRAGAGVVAVVTPAHQYPTGVVLSAERRTALAAWAHATGGYIVEDDYDAEYRYDRQPVGALQGVAPDRVIYSGTMSKSLAPGVRLGWMVVPPALVDEVADARITADRMPNTLVQATFVEFLERGDLDRHLRRSRRVYRERRDALVTALERWLPGTKVSGVSAGLSVLVTLPEGWDSEEVASQAREHGVGVYPPREGCTDPDLIASSLVIGYGTLRPDQIEQGIRLLATALSW